MKRIPLKIALTGLLCVIAPPVFVWELARELGFCARIAWRGSFSEAAGTIKDIWKA